MVDFPFNISSQLFASCSFLSFLSVSLSTSSVATFLWDFMGKQNTTKILIQTCTYWSFILIAKLMLYLNTSRWHCIYLSLIVISVSRPWTHHNLILRHLLQSAGSALILWFQHRSGLLLSNGTCYEVWVHLGANVLLADGSGLTTSTADISACTSCEPPNSPLVADVEPQEILLRSDSLCSMGLWWINIRGL